MKIPLARVSDLAEQVRGVSYKKEEVLTSPKSGYLPVLRAGNITDDGLVFDDLVFVPAERISKKQKIRRYDVVVAASSGSLDVVGKAAPMKVDFEGGFGAFCKVLRPNSKVHPDYFAHFFKTKDYRQRISALAAGANINNLRNEHLDEMQIPLPSLDEQRRIADILDHAEALRAKRRAALAQLDELIEAIFIDMFGDSVSNPMGWKRYPLKHCVNHIQIGPFGSLLHKEDYVFGGIPLINPTHIEGGKIVPDLNQSITVQKHAELQLYQLRQGDVIMGRRGEMGRCAIVGSEHDGMLCGTGSLFIRPDESKATAIYLQATLSSTTMRKHLEGFSLGATLPNLNRGIVGELSISLPPIELQKEFSNHIESIEKLKAAYKSSLAELNEFFISLQYRAFRGEL